MDKADNFLKLRLKFFAEGNSMKSHVDVPKFCRENGLDKAIFTDKMRKKTKADGQRQRQKRARMASAAHSPTPDAVAAHSSPSPDSDTDSDSEEVDYESDSGSEEEDDEPVSRETVRQFLYNIRPEVLVSYLNIFYDYVLLLIIII